MPKPPAIHPTILFTALLVRSENRELDVSADAPSQPFARQMHDAGVLAATDEPHTYLLTDKGHHVLRLLESLRDYSLGIHS
ncbi:MAG: hypothetical protein ACO1TE_29265 [Prosthecobacter sp.]